MPYKIEITPEMKKGFASEAAEHLDRFENALMVLEKTPSNKDAINIAFRAVHTIKGNSDYLGVKDINELSHHLEDLMDEIRSTKLIVTEKILTLLFDGLDTLREMNKAIVEPDYEEREISQILTRIVEVIQDTGAEKPESQPVSAPKLNVLNVFAHAANEHVEFISKTVEQVLVGESATNARDSVLRIVKTFKTSANYVGLSELATLVGTLENVLKADTSFSIATANYIKERIEPIIDQVNQLLGPESPVVGAPRTEASFDGPGTETSTDVLKWEVRIEPEKIDVLMDELSEFIIAENTLNYLRDTHPVRRNDPEWENEFNRALARVQDISRNFQAGIMSMRLVKFQSVFERLPRILREVALRNRKKVELSLSGGDTEIDRKVIEYVVDPLIHLIRNAVDHGIEPPEDRISREKPAHGTVSVKACQQGNHVVIEIADDGKGVAIKNIRREAVRRKIYSEKVLASMSDEDLINIVFMPGFSTVSAASLTSGRGVGLDVVKTNIKAVGGNVTLSSKMGIGSTVTLQVPVSMALMDVLLTDTAGEYYAFPFSTILETIRVVPSDIRVINRREVMTYRNTVLRVKHLAEILGLRKMAKLRTLAPKEELSIIVTLFGGQIRGVVVDRIVRRESVLARPLDKHLARVKEFTGAALLGDGTVVLIVDPAELY